MTSIEKEVLTEEEIMEKYDLVEEENRNHDVDDELSMNTGMSVSEYSYNKKRKSVSESVKRSDSGYYKYYIQKKKMKIKVEVYSTKSGVGTLIRCPFTGMRTNDRVGSFEENYYFKVRFPVVGNGDEPVTLYYTTPESYERHHMCDLGEKSKEDWRNRRKMFISEEVYEEGDVEIK